MKLRNKKRLKQQQKVTNHDKIIREIKSKNISLDECLDLISTFDDTFFESSALELELLISNGMPLDVQNNEVSLKTARTPFSKQRYCIVDIETSGSDVNKGQIIELGAVKYCDGEIVDKFDSLVYAKRIPPYIQEVTKITPRMLENAPPLSQVLEEFKIFLEDDVFIAHDIKFDYKFISDSFEKYDLGKLENRKLCTIDLSKRTIVAQRYGLDFLKILLNVDIKDQHRAYIDALSTTYIFEHALKNIPTTIQTTEDLIDFSKSDNILKQPEKKTKQKKEEN